MNSQKIMPVKNPTCTCWKCLKEKKNDTLHFLELPSCGYGSFLDNLSTKLCLCDECFNATDPEWWKFETKDLTEDFPDSVLVYDDEIYRYIKTLPLEGQELVWNRYAYGACASLSMEPQDWIDFKLNELPHEKCKEYGLYSPDEVNAYKNRFETCQFPVNRIFSDGSAGCWCFNGASGNAGQKAGVNISEECYQCPFYRKRTTPLESIEDKDWTDHYITMMYHLKIAKDM